MPNTPFLYTAFHLQYIIVSKNVLLQIPPFSRYYDTVKHNRKTNSSRCLTPFDLVMYDWRQLQQQPTHFQTLVQKQNS